MRAACPRFLMQPSEPCGRQTGFGGCSARSKSKGTLLGTPNREPQEYSRYTIGIYLPGSLYSIIFLLYSWGSLFGVPSRVPLKSAWGYLLQKLLWGVGRLNPYILLVSMSFPFVYQSMLHKWGDIPVYIYIYIFMYLSMHVCMCIYIYIYIPSKVGWLRCSV